MTNLDVLLLKGPTGGDPEEGLNELRYTILMQGIPANSEGMVRWFQLIRGYNGCPATRTEQYIQHPVHH
jgi:hypothetical protein